MARMKFQGVTNIIRFNWHFYVIAFVAIIGLSSIPYSGWLIVLAAGSIIVSLTVSYYVYDLAGLYTLDWLDLLDTPATIVNINAGFDETSILLSGKYPQAQLNVFDFYDPAKHTEVSIKRARKAYPPYPGTVNITTDNVPSLNADMIFLIMAAHEIRNKEERHLFFNKLRECLHDEGKIIVLEHLRDIPNFMAYNIGYFHFYSKRTWKDTFAAAGLNIHRELKITPFLSAFILYKNGSTS